jgi:hypothetical protein
VLCLLNLMSVSLLSCLQVSLPRDGEAVHPGDIWRIMIEWCVLSLCLSRRGTPSSRSPVHGLATVDTDLPIVGGCGVLQGCVSAWLGACGIGYQGRLSASPLVVLPPLSICHAGCLSCCCHCCCYYRPCVTLAKVPFCLCLPLSQTTPHHPQRLL